MTPEEFERRVSEYPSISVIPIDQWSESDKERLKRAWQTRKETK